MMNENLLEIRQQLLAITHNSVFADAIRTGATTDLNSTIDMIRSQAKDNRVLVMDIVGENVLMLIEEL